MGERVVWKLSEKDFEDIQNLYEKKLALENLTKIMNATDSELYERLIEDYGKTLYQFNHWWKEMSEKYNWEGSNWWIKFETQEVISDD